MMAGCQSSDRASFRFLMRTDVQTPSGLRSGSSVLEESAEYGTFVTSETGKGKAFLRGDALVIDLPDGPVFVLLKMPDDRGSLGAVATQALSGGKPLTGFDDLFGRVRKLAGWFGGAKAHLPREHWPMFVRFRDLHDPTTVEEVNPDTIGVRDVVLETTSSPVSHEIRKRLPWLSSDPEPSLNPDHGPTDYSLSATLHHVDFSHEKPL